MGKGKIARNTISSLLLQFCTVICGFIVPKLILSNYGSDVNGLVNSITQFLSFIALLDLGVGAVVQSALYKPLADKDARKLNEIMTSADRFFRMIGGILFIYVLILIVLYPLVVKQNFGYIYTAGLIIAISISSFSQYYFGVVDRLLLTADQKGYIQYDAQIVTLILNTIACAILIKLGGSIHIVKLTTSLIYLARPIYLRYYIKKNYVLNRNANYKEEPVKQKWNGIAQHISAVVLNETDTIVLTLFSSLASVSIYSVYNLVVSGLKKLFESATNGIEAALGEVWAKKEYKQASQLFKHAEWMIHTSVTYVFICTAILIVPFVSVYTKNITDAEYRQPVFAILIVLAHTVHCYRIPYHMMIKAAGHYKQTQNCYLIATIINIVVSVATVKYYGLIGVAVGTLVAMLYQTIWMINYNVKHLIKESVWFSVKQFFVDGFSFFLCFFLVSDIVTLPQKTYISWIMMSVKTMLIVGGILIVINTLTYNVYVKKIIDKILGGRARS